MSDYLPQEILIQIFIKLPVKSLIRAASVCKPWRSLIRSPFFISAHLSNTENQTLLRRYDFTDSQEHYTLFPKGGPLDINSSSELEFHFKRHFGYSRIIGCCNGLLCLSDDILGNSSQPITIWNPAIKSQVVLPQFLVKGIFLAGLGFGVANNVYKVVRLVYNTNANGSLAPPQAEIFSLGAGTWSILSRFDVGIRSLQY